MTRIASQSAILFATRGLFIFLIVLTGPVTVASPISTHQTTDSQIEISVNDSSTSETVSATVPISIKSSPDDTTVDVNGDGNPATDIDGDGMFEDVNGDNAANIGDVQTLINGIDTGSINDGDSGFNFNNDDNESVNIGDVQALINQI